MLKLSPDDFLIINYFIGSQTFIHKRPQNNLFQTVPKKSKRKTKN